MFEKSLGVFLFYKMEKLSGSGNHGVELRNCSNPDCKVVFNVQTGGQKAGSSPAVHVEKVGETPKGYCSAKCLHDFKGWNIQPVKDWYAKMGIDHDHIFPPGYLAPARKIESSETIEYEGGEK